MTDYLYSGTQEKVESIRSNMRHPDHYKCAPIAELTGGAVIMGEVQYLDCSFPCAYYTKKIYRNNDEYRITTSKAGLILDLNDYVIVRK